jgi:multicomponent K+:H+ antiporter subunit D
MGEAGVTGGALFYMVSSTLGLAALFLLVELVERGREPGADVLAVTREAYGDDDLDDEEEVGVAIPATMGMLGIAFIGCALVIAGLPPLSGFIAKFALLTAALNPVGSTEGVRTASWALLAILILSGLAAVIAMTRAGMRSFWASPDRAVPRVRIIEMAPVAILLILCVMQTIQAGPVTRYMHATAQWLHTSQNYVRDVMQAEPGPEARKAGRR